MLLFAGCQCAVLFRGRTNREARLFFFLFFFFFFLYIFFIFLFPDSFEHCRFFYHRDQFHCSKPARSDQARLTHETHWSVSGENSHRGGWRHLRRGFPHDGGKKGRKKLSFFCFFGKLFWLFLSGSCCSFSSMERGQTHAAWSCCNSLACLLEVGNPTWRRWRWPLCIQLYYSTNLNQTHNIKTFINRLHVVNYLFRQLILKIMSAT